jgi:DNA-binding IscR family transcriptional regulator
MMTHRECSFAVLLALFDLARAGLPSSATRVAGRLDLPVAPVEAALARLASTGLVSGSRLTLPGLALASSLDATRASLNIRLAA